MIETIRKTVKDFGKEAATYRFTPEEKKQLAEIAHTYKMQGIRTSENEITRIAVNFLIHEHTKFERDGILDRVIRALHE